MDINFKQIERTTVTENIIDQIKEKILSGEIKPGEKFPSERVLAESLCVGRTSVREALRALQYMGVLEVRCGEGTFLSKNTSIFAEHFKASHLLKRFSVRELVEARKIVEGSTVYLAAKRSSPDERHILQEIYLQAEKNSGDERKFLNADFDFHKKIAEMSQNSVLVEMLFTVRELTLKENTDVIKKYGQIEQALLFHRKILEAILACDPARARREMIEHLENIENTIASLCEKQFGEEGGDVKKNG